MLSNQKEISRIFEKGSSKVSRYFIARAIANQVEEPRFVFAVSRKYGNSVHRNRIKRQVREILRCNLDIIPRGFDFAIIPRRSAQNANFDQLTKGLLAALCGSCVEKEKNNEANNSSKH